ncbi:MAG: PD-(D/E)XK nuclease family protein [Acidobacteriaceae bacterium]
MSNFLAWSYSRLKMFRECPKQVWHAAVVPRGHPDRVEFKQSKPMLDGIEIDNALTARISKGIALPPKFAPYEAMVGAIMASPGEKLTQVQLALDQTFAPCGYKDWDTAWVRVIYDLLIVHGERAWIWDWKNGQVWLDEDQLRLFATVGFHYLPDVQAIDTSYVWLQHGITSDASYRRRELPDLWQTFIPDVERLQSAFKATHWPAEPLRGKASCKYCAVNAARKCPVALIPYAGG